MDMKTKRLLADRAIALVKRNGFDRISDKKLRSLISEGERVKQESPLEPGTEELLTLFRAEVKRRNASQR